MDITEAISRTEALVELIASEAPQAEADRKVTEPVVQALWDADLFRIVVPTSLGGHGLGLDAFGEVTRTMANGCPATAWTMSFMMLHGWMMAKLPEAGREEVFATSPVPFTPAPLAPTGKAVPTNSGYHITGRWEWATGIAHGEWVLVHAIVDGPDFSTIFAAIPISEVSIDDVWFTSGMRATRSNTVVIKDVFVPTHRTIAATELLDSTGKVEGDGLAGLPVMSALALGAAAPALGGAEAAFELYRTRLKERVLAFTLGDKAVHQPAAQIRLATVGDLVATAGNRWRTMIEVLMNTAEPKPELRVEARLAAASVVRMSRQAISIAAEGAGASVYFDSHPLQRIQRDIETLKGHVLFDWDRTAELAGRISLGFEVRPGDMI